jgi:ABC-2 type transport system permease protein
MTTVTTRSSATAVGSPATARRRALAGTQLLLVTALRRDRLLLPLWALLIVVVAVGGGASVDSTYPTEQAVQDRYDQIQALPMFVLFQSQAFAATSEALVAQQAFGGTTIFAAIGAVLFVVRHTRSEEQRGRLELVRSSAVGHAAPLAAAVLLVGLTGLLIGLASAAGLVATGLPTTGSVLLGLIATGAVWIAVAVTAVLTQVFEHTRTAGAVAVVIVYGLHFVRGLGHLTDTAWVTWASPSGWLEGTRAYAGDRWWPLAPVLAAVVAALALAFALSARRDLGAGLVPARRGHATAPASLSGAAGMAWRQNRMPFLVWTLAFVALGLAFGSGGAAAVADYARSPWAADYAAAIGLDDPAAAFFVYVEFVLVFPVAAYAILTLLRVRHDEVSGIAELTLAAPVARVRWVATSVGAALAGSATILALLGLTLAATAPGIDGVLPVALRLIPAVWVLIGVATLTFGLAPRATVPVAWLALTIGVFGEILVKAGLPDVVYLATSPFAHVSPYYTTPWSPYVLLALAAGLITAGLAGVRRRDLPR